MKYHAELNETTFKLKRDRLSLVIILRQIFLSTTKPECQRCSRHDLYQDFIQKNVMISTTIRLLTLLIYIYTYMYIYMNTDIYSETLLVPNEIIDT